jgi:hypothetical protein
LLRTKGFSKLTVLSFMEYVSISREIWEEAKLVMGLEP